MLVEKSTRKFKGPSSYQKDVAQYFLLPYRFISISDKRELLVNEVGDYVIAAAGTATKIASREISPSDAIYPELISNFFISEEPIPSLLEVLATRYRTKKSFLDQFTTLHIFVVTLRCDHSCHYCQVSRKTQSMDEFDISLQDLDAAILLMFKSPSPYITAEFQGGEPLLAFDKVKYAVAKILNLNKQYKKEVSFVICTTLANLTKEVLEFCKQHNILLSSSFDGPDYVHNKNRPKTGAASYDLFLQGLEMAREALGDDKVSALMTTTVLSLDYPKEIIDSYLEHGFNSIFLRPISPYGFALKNEKRNLYETDRFLEFYKQGLDYIIALNTRGVYIVEEYAALILKKILTPFATGYVDLQSPAGLINSVIVFNYDGYVYATDESRMLAESKDFTFRLGHVKEDSYEEIFYGHSARTIAEVWSNEALPGCSECALVAYCGADPVQNYATQRDMVGYRPTSAFCKRNMGIMLYLFQLLDEKGSIVGPIFRSWANNNMR